MARAFLIVLLGAVAAAGGYFFYTSSMTTESVAVNVPVVGAPQSTDQYLDVAGTTIRLRDEGPRDAPVLLMLHGFTFSLETWDAVASELINDYRVIRYDLLGHGLTGADALQRYAPLERATFLSKVIDELDLDDSTIIGNSLGGLVAWRYAALNPEALQALVLISPGAYPFNGVGDEPAPVPMAVAFALRNPNLLTVKASFRAIYGGATEPTDERLVTALSMMEGNGDAFVQSLEEFTLPNPEPDLAKVAAPTLIVWGEEDALISPQDGPKMQAVMQDARLVTYPGVGHVAQEEAPQQLANDIRDFLSNRQAQLSNELTTDE